MSILLLLFTGLSIQPPPENISIGQPVTLLISGVASNQWPTAKIQVEPEGLQVFEGFTRELKPVLICTPSKEGRFVLTVTVPPTDEVTQEAIAKYRKAIGSALELFDANKLSVAQLKTNLDSLTFQAPSESSTVLFVVGPRPPPDPPVSLWQIAFFVPGEHLDNLTLSQTALVSGRKFRDELTQAGHVFLGSFDPHATISNQSQGLSMFFDRAQGYQSPVMIIAPRQGGMIRVFELPKDRAEFYETLAEASQ